MGEYLFYVSGSHKISYKHEYDLSISESSQDEGRPEERSHFSSGARSSPGCSMPARHDGACVLV